VWIVTFYQTDAATSVALQLGALFVTLIILISHQPGRPPPGTPPERGEVTLFTVPALTTAKQEH